MKRLHVLVLAIAALADLYAVPPTKLTESSSPRARDAENAFNECLTTLDEEDLVWVTHVVTELCG